MSPIIYSIIHEKCFPIALSKTIILDNDSV